MFTDVAFVGLNSGVYSWEYNKVNNSCRIIFNCIRLSTLAVIASKKKILQYIKSIKILFSYG